MVRTFNRKIHFASAADAPPPSGISCHLRLHGGRTPFVALRHFPRFIGDIYPFHRESLPQRGKQEELEVLQAKFSLLIKILKRFILFSLENFIKHIVLPSPLGKVSTKLTKEVKISVRAYIRLRFFGMSGAPSPTAKIQ